MLRCVVLPVLQVGLSAACVAALRFRVVARPVCTCEHVAGRQGSASTQAVHGTPLVVCHLCLATATVVVCAFSSSSMAAAATTPAAAEAVHMGWLLEHFPYAAR